MFLFSHPIRSLYLAILFSLYARHLCTTKVRARRVFVCLCVEITIMSLELCHVETHRPQ